MSHFVFRSIPALIAAVLATALLASIVQTQFNLLALQSMGVALEPVHWVETTFSDLLGFTPVMAVLATVTFVIAFPISALISARWIRSRALVFPLAAALGLLVALQVVDQLAPMPTLIAATRSLAGTLALALCAGIGGLLYARMAAPRDPSLIID